MLQAMDEASRSPFVFPLLGSRKQRRPPDDPFFRTGDEERELLAKQAALELSPEEATQLASREEPSGQGWTCPYSGCSVHLDGPAAFDQHYSAAHVNSCRVCGRVFPTTRLLSIHLAETHDAFFQAKAARGFPVYECLVEGCGNKFQTGVARQQHLKDRHHFPATFSFQKGRQRPLKEKGKHSSKQVEGARGLVRKAEKGSKNNQVRGRMVNGSKEGNMQVVEEQVEMLQGGKEMLSSEVSTVANEEGLSTMDLDSLSTGFSRLSTANGKGVAIPRSVTFGRNRGRLFDSTVLVQKPNAHNVRSQTIPQKVLT